MSVFGGDYSAYYDLFYAGKDYAAEAAFVRAVIERNRPGARSLLEFGCGSARHALELVRAGFAVTGLDRSAGMIARGREQREALPPDLRERLTLLQGDATSYAPTERHDAVISLFHVVSYQTTDQALNGIFRSARSALAPGGLFVFDFWHGPAVLHEPPERRVRRISTAEVDLTRTAEPTHHAERHVVDVQYTLTATDPKTGRSEQSVEVHSMRYLFLPELERLAEANDFAVVEAGEWLTGERLDQRCWSGFVALRATAGS